MSFINFFEKFVQNKTNDTRNTLEMTEQQGVIEENKNLIAIEVN